ncbi:MAG: PaaI family thioesterase [Pseudomonadota bacterium]
MSVALSGLDTLRARIAADDNPSMGVTLGFGLTEVGAGTATFAGAPAAHLLNPLGTVHAAWAFGLLDSACWCAAFSTLPAGVATTTLETKINLVRAITLETGPVRCEAHVVANGRTVITAEGRVLDGGGRVMAHGTSTLLVLCKTA